MKKLDHRSSLAALLSVVIIATAVAATAQAGGPKPDLKIKNAALDDFEVDQGAASEVRFRVSNVGAAAAKASVARAYASVDRKKDSSDARLGGSKRVSNLRSGASTAGILTVTIPSVLAPGTYSVLVCADDARSVKESSESNNCSAASGEIAVTEPTDTDLIRSAEAAGTITSDQALVYELFSVFGDPGLPSEYRGADDGLDGVGTLREVAGRYDSLPPALQVQVDPFFVPPAYGGSWFDRYETQPMRATGSPGVPSALPKTSWETLDSGAKVKVWWQQSQPENEDVARSVLSETEGVIWPKLEALMGTPLADGHLPAGGGDGRLDIYLSEIPADLRGPEDALGVTVPFLGCGNSPSYLVVDPAKFEGGSDNFKGTLAHELMHAFQNRFAVKSCSAYNWLYEGTAEWAIDHVYQRSVQAEHSNALQYLVRPSTPIDQNDPYGSYLLPFYVAGQGSAGASKIRAIWDAAATKDPFPAIEGAAGTLDNLWPGFVAANWNDGGETTYKEWDNLTSGAVPYGTAPPATGASLTVDPKVIGGNSRQNLPAGVAPVAAHYFWYSFTNKVRHITFTHPFSGSSVPGASIQAMLKIDGVWKLFQDWGDKEKREFCRDKPGENVSEMVVAIANSNPKQKLQPGDSTELKTKTSCGGNDWSGTFSGTATDSSNHRVEWTGHLTWIHRPDKRYPDTLLHDAEGRITYTITDGFGCTGTKSFDVTKEHGDSYAGSMSIFTDDDFYSARVYATLEAESVELTCPDGYTKSTSYYFSWLETSSQPWNPDMTTLSGRRTVDIGSNHIVWQWSFSK